MEKKNAITLQTVVQWLVAILKGTLVGLAIVIPGVSGGSMLLTIGVYEDAISITSKDKEIRRRSIIKLIPYAIGIVLGVAVLSFVITWLLANFEFYTVLLFCGLILGVLPMLFKQIRSVPVKPQYIAVLLLTAAIMIALPLLNNRTQEDFELLTGNDRIDFNERIILVEDSADLPDTMTVKKQSSSFSVLKVKSPLPGLAGMRASIEDGIKLEYESAEDTYLTDEPISAALSESGTLTVNGTVYHVYRSVDHLSKGITSSILAAVLGFIAAGTMIVPGISGSMVLLVLGYYNSIMTHLKTAIICALSFSFSELLPHLAILIPFALGIVLGLLFVSKAIKWLLVKHPIPTYYGIIGLMLTSPYAILMKSTIISSSFFSSFRWYHAVIGLICLAAGILSAVNLSKEKKS